jgi:hypothetical protein
MSSATLILAVTFIANLPWVTERLFGVFTLSNGKSGWIRLFELLVFYFITLVAATMVETKLDGAVHPQDWEFFVITFSGYLVLAVPGLVYRYQWLPLKQK